MSCAETGSCVQACGPRNRCLFAPGSIPTARSGLHVIRVQIIGGPELSFDGPSIVIGRARGSDVALADDAVSSQHARISLHPSTP